MFYTDDTARAERALNFEQDSYMFLLDATPSESFMTLDPAYIIEQLQNLEETDNV
jgi:hypothetical protein